METATLKKIIEEQGIGHYRITLNDGSTQDRRLFISSTDEVCEFKKGGRTRGHRLSYFLDHSRIASLEKRDRTDPYQPTLKALMRNLGRIHKGLSASGLWPKHLRNVGILSTLPEEDLQTFVELSDYRAGSSMNKFYERFQQFCQDHGLDLSLDEAFSLCCPSCIKTLRYKKGDHWTRLRVRDAISLGASATPGDFSRSFRWRNGYDNSVEIRKETDGTLHGWYSEEYKDCGNGYYWLLLDQDHCFFCEKD